MTDKPDGKKTVESLFELEIYKLHNTAVGNARQSLDDYIELSVEGFK